MDILTDEPICVMLTRRGRLTSALIIINAKLNAKQTLLAYHKAIKQSQQITIILFKGEKTGEKRTVLECL